MKTNQISEQSVAKKEADWCNPVSLRPNEVEDFENILFEDIELEYKMRRPQSTRPFCSFVLTSTSSRVVILQIRIPVPNATHLTALDVLRVKSYSL